MNTFRVFAAAGLLVALAGFASVNRVELATSGVGVEDAASMATTAPTAVERERIVRSYGKLPLVFEKNQGQADARVQYFSRGSGYALFLTADEAVMSLRSRSNVVPAKAGIQYVCSAGKSKLDSRLCGNDDKRQTAVLRAKLLGANPKATAVGEEPLPGHSNYFIGSDKSRWRTGVPQYAKVRYRDVYPGIDLVYYGNQRQLEYDFVVAAGADPSRIRFAYSGAKKIRIDERGDLRIATRNGDLAQHKPLVYQFVDGRRRLVEGCFKLIRNGKAAEVAFMLGTYDRSRALIIDPVLAYSTYLGGSTASDQAYAVAVDSTGDAYLAGATRSTDFPTQHPAIQGTNAGGDDAFIVKLNSDGTALLFATYLGGSGDDVATAVAIDPMGGPVIAGATNSTDFPGVAINAIQNHYGGGLSDAFVAHLNADGTTFTATYLGGSGVDYANGVAVDGSDEVVVAGVTGSGDFPVVNALQSSYGGDVTDGFVAKIGSSGLSLVYSTYLGGNLIDKANAIAVDGSGNAYVTGQTSSTDFPTVNAEQAIVAGETDAFVAKLNAGGSALVYSTYLGGSAEDEAYAIAVDGSGEAYVAGETNSNDFPMQNPQQATMAGVDDAFVAKLNAGGNALVYSTYLGGSDEDEAYAIAVDANGYAYIAGDTLSNDFPVVHALQAMRSGGPEAIAAKLTPAGDALVWSTYLGGSGEDKAFGVALDGSGDVYLTGLTASSDFPTAGPLQTYAGPPGVFDAFVAKLAPAPGQLQFALANYSAGENAGTATIGVLRAGGVDDAVSVNYATSNGSGAAGVNYQPASGTLNWAAGDNSTKFFTVTVLDDHTVNGDHTVNLTLSDPTGSASLGVPNTAALTIAETDSAPPPAQPGALQFSSSSYLVGEKGGSVTITVDRGGGTDGAVSVQYATSDGTGLAGTNYTAASGTLNWGSGDAAPKSFTVPVKDDGAVDGDHTVNLALSDPTGGAILAAPSTAVLTVAEADTRAPILEFGMSSYSTPENAGAATISVVRTGSTDGAVSVHYATSDGSGQSGVNYSAVSGTLTWADGDSAPKTFAVPVLDDGIADGDHSVNLALSAPAGGAMLGAPNAAVLTVTNIDSPPPPGSVQFGLASYSASEQAGAATITVTRQGGSSGAVSVDYATADGSGVAGVNYATTTGTLSWNDGDNATKTFSVPVLDDGLADGDRTVNLKLSNPAGGATLGVPSTALLTVSNADAPTTLSFGAAGFEAGEKAGAATVTVIRSGSSKGTVSVDYATADGTGVNGTHYTATSGTLSWDDGDTGARTFDVPVIDDKKVDGDHTVNLALSNPTGGAALSSPSTAVLTVAEADQKPQVIDNGGAVTPGALLPLLGFAAWRRSAVRSTRRARPGACGPGSNAPKSTTNNSPNPS